MGNRSLARVMAAVMLMLVMGLTLGSSWIGQVMLNRSAVDATMSRMEALALERADWINQRWLIGAFPASLCEPLIDSDFSLTLVDTQGRPLCDTLASPTRMENMLRLPEVAAGLSGRTGYALRRSQPQDEPVLTVAVPVGEGSGIHGVLVLSQTQSGESSLVGSLWRRMLVIGGGTALMGLLVLLLLEHQLQRVMVEIARGARRLASGDFSTRWGLPVYEESVEAVTALNGMAAALQKHITDLQQGQTQREELLDSMVEAVIAVDTEERVLEINPSAARLLEVSAEAARGRYLVEVAPIPELTRFTQRVLQSREPIHGEIQLFRDREELTYSVQGAPLLGEKEKLLGAMVVLHDLTQIRKLEGMRRSFVANVSHEMRTPLTAIMGWVDFLNVTGKALTPDMTKALGIIERQSQRLAAIVEDLLELSRIEEDEETGKLDLRLMPLLPVLEAAEQSCLVAAREKEMELVLDCPEELEALVEPHMLERAVVNLISNAIRYSPEKTTVTIRGSLTSACVEIQVQDQGPGVPARHQGRIFERFYRVDRARSRELGGTGLGLAIVRHIARLHGGEALVESEPGKGSIFRIRLPGKT